MSPLPHIHTVSTEVGNGSEPQLHGVPRGGSKARHLENLRQVVAKLERRNAAQAVAVLPFGISEIDQRLPGGGLTCGLLHEMSPTSHRERPAVLGFVLGLAASALGARRGHAVFV